MLGAAVFIMAVVTFAFIFIATYLWSAQPLGRAGSMFIGSGLMLCALILTLTLFMRLWV